MAHACSAERSVYAQGILQPAQRTVVGGTGHDRANKHSSDNNKLDAEHCAVEKLFKMC